MNNPTIHVSMIIPTHNRADLLRQSLESISQLDIPAGKSVELLIIANACTDQTVTICEAAADKMPFPCRCVAEPQAGLSHARNRALAEARGEILAFLDDDIWVDKNWLHGLLEIFDNYPADVAAGKVALWWQAVAKPMWMTHRSEHLLSSVDYGDRANELFAAGEAVGANLAIRRRVLTDVSAFRTDLDRQGRTVLAGGDTYFITECLKSGHRMFYAPRAVIKHWVSPERITLPYLSSAAYANGLARIQMIDKLSAVTAGKLAVENALKFCFYGIAEMLATASGSTRSRINHRIRRMTCRGVLAALRKR